MKNKNKIEVNQERERYVWLLFYVCVLTMYSSCKQSIFLITNTYVRIRAIRQLVTVKLLRPLQCKHSQEKITSQLSLCRTGICKWEYRGQTHSVISFFSLICFEVCVLIIAMSCHIMSKLNLLLTLCL